MESVTRKKSRVGPTDQPRSHGLGTLKTDGQDLGEGRLESYSIIFNDEEHSLIAKGGTTEAEISCGTEDLACFQEGGGGGSPKCGGKQTKLGKGTNNRLICQGSRARHLEKKRLLKGPVHSMKQSGGIEINNKMEKLGKKKLN